MKGIWVRCLSVLLIASIAGCGTVKDLPSCETPDRAATSGPTSRPAPGATIALAAGRFNPPIKLDDKVYDHDRHLSEGLRVQDPASGAAVGALGGAGACLYLAIIHPLIAAACLPYGATAGAVAGGVAGGVKAVEANTPEEQEKAASQAARRRIFEEQMADAKAAEQRVAAVVEPVDLNRILLEQVKQYARESDVGNLAELPGQGPQSISDQPRYHAKQDYVAEIVLMERIVNTLTYDTLDYSVGFSARARLVRVADNAVVKIFTTSAVTEARNANVWAANNGKLLVEDLGNALQQIAKRAVDQLIRPTVTGDHGRDATVVITWPVRKDSSVYSPQISIDGCLVGSLHAGSFITIQTWAGKHTIRSEELSIAPRSYYFGEIELRLNPGETRYLSFEINQWRESFYQTNKGLAEETIGK